MTTMDRINIDVGSATWVSIRDWATAKITTCRKRNDAQLPMENTAALRGEIAVLKELLALEQAKPIDNLLPGHDRDVR